MAESKAKSKAKPKSGIKSKSSSKPKTVSKLQKAAKLKSASKTKIDVKSKGKAKAGTATSNEVTFKCGLCGKQKPISEMKIIKRFRPVIFVCQDCERFIQ
jgi:hypothetical protein